MTNIETLQDIAHRLVGLIDNPEPGLMTWRAALADVRSELAKFFGYCEPSDTQPCGHPRSAIAGGPTTWWCSMCGEELNDRTE